MLCGCYYTALQFVTTRVRTSDLLAVRAVIQSKYRPTVDNYSTNPPTPPRSPGGRRHPRDRP